MKYRVVLAEEAYLDLIRLAAFLADLNPDASDRAVDVISAALQTLEEAPQRGHSTALEGYRELKIPFGKRAYFARYEVTAATVLITRIHHSNENRG